MATIITGHWGNNYSPQAQLDVNVSSQNGGSVTYSYTLKYITHGYAAYTNGQARGYTISIGGQNIGGSININGIGTTTVKTGTVTISKENNARNIGFSITFDMSVSWAGAWKTTVYANGAIGVPARESHTVSYNANGGSGAPSAQTKWYGSILTLSGTKPSRYGYTFQGWCKNSATGSVNYQPNSQYGYDENATMYAVWSPNPYTITYNANGGSGAPSNQTKYHDQNITLSGTRPSKTNYNFLGWATSSGATSASYQPSSTYTQNSNITLYAVWQLAYKAPRISNVTADRSNSGGTYQETGQYAKVSFSWSTDKTVSGIKIEWKSSTSSTWSSATASASGTNGTVNQVIGNNGISTEYTYNIRITVSDSVGSSTYNIDVPAMLYTMDFKAGGKGVAIGKPATEDNLFDINFPARFSGGVDYVIIPDNADLNNYRTAGFYRIPYDGNGTVGGSSIKNSPIKSCFSMKVEQARGYGSSGDVGYRQTLVSPYDNRIFTRRYTNGTWTPWVEMVDSGTFNTFFDNRMNATFDGKFNNRIHKKLWTGTLSKGQTINVPNFSKYNLVACQPGSDGILLVGYKTGVLNGGSTGQVHLSAGTGFGAWYNISFKYDGDSVTYSDGGNILTNIIGII